MASDISNWMIYGANGYTGELIAREVVRRGQRPILAGRSRAAMDRLAGELACPARSFAIDDAAGAAGELAGVRLVLNCAGPFSATGEPMMEACLRAGAHYLDITGEIAVLEAAADRDARARQAGVCLIPAVGFDVVPTDCLAAMLKDKLPDANLLQLAFWHRGGLSQGTAKSSLEALPRGGRIRRDGRIVRVPVAWQAMRVPFSRGPHWAMTIPWGDVSTAWHTTGIPQIETYMAMERAMIWGARALRPFLPLLGWPPLLQFLQQRIARNLRPPTEKQRLASRAYLWGRVANAEGKSVEATLDTPGGYPLTVVTALACVDRVLHSRPVPGFHTPSRVFGQDFILQFEDVQFAWREPVT